LAVTEREINKGITFQREQESDFVGYTAGVVGIVFVNIECSKVDIIWFEICLFKFK
jgi:hypothetical protein